MIFSEQPKKVNNLLIAVCGEIITLQQAVSGGVVKAYLDSGTDEILCLEIDPSRIPNSRSLAMPDAE